MMDAVILVQARMESTRLPGKVIMPLKGKPLIIRLLDKLSLLKVKKIICAISSDKESLPLRNLLQREKIAFYAGEPLNVYQRFIDALIEFNISSQVIVRVTADNPLTDIGAIEKGVAELVDNDLDYLWIDNCPVGMGCDIFKFDTFSALGGESLLDSEKEHIIPAFRNRSYLKEGFISAGFPPAAKQLSFTVDTREQYDAMEEIFSDYYQQDFGVDNKRLVQDYLNKKL